MSTSADRHDDASSDAPTFRDWADDPANAMALDALIADFIADEGLEMVSELITCQGQQHQWASERWIERLQERFEQWWSNGCPRLAARGVRISYHMPMLEEEAQRLLASNLPPSAIFALTRRWRKLAGGESEMIGWSCKIEDGRAEAMAQGTTPALAARKALDAWREFVTASRFELDTSSVADEIPAERPPLLDAPSAGADQANQDRDKKAI